jgi:hypothetical protein
VGRDKDPSDFITVQVLQNDIKVAKGSKIEMRKLLKLDDKDIQKRVPIEKDATIKVHEAGSLKAGADPQKQAGMQLRANASSVIVLHCVAL